MVARAPGALQEGGDRTRRTELADQVDIADVQAQLQRGGGHQHLQLAGLELLLGLQPQLPGKAAVVGAHVLPPEQLAQVEGGALGHAPGVDEHQGGAVFAHPFDQARVDLLPLLVGHHRRQRRGRQFQSQIALLGVADVDDGAVGHPGAGAAAVDRADAIAAQRRPLRQIRSGRVHIPGADQEARHLLHRLLRGRQADTHQRAAAQRLQPLQRQRQVAAALVVGQGVDLVHDHAAHRAQHRPARGRTEQHVQRFGRGHQNMRRLAAQPGALGLRRVASAHHRADLHFRQTQLGQRRADPGQRRLQVQGDVVGQRLQRRNVDHPGLVRQCPAVGQPLAHQRVDRGQEGGQGLARAGRRGHQGVAAGHDRRPRRDLGGSGARKGAVEPAGHGGMEGGGGHGWARCVNSEPVPRRSQQLRRTGRHRNGERSEYAPATGPLQPPRPSPAACPAPGRDRLTYAPGPRAGIRAVSSVGRASDF